MKKTSLLLVLVFLLSGCSKNEEPIETTSAATVYFVADTPRGFKLFSEKQEFPKSADLAQSVISDLVSGVTSPKDASYANLWGSESSINSIESSGSVATIDFGAISLNVGSDGEQRAIDQIVWTYLELAPSIKSVRFTLNGESIESFAGHVDTTGEFVRAPDYEVLNPLQISSISEDEVVTNPIKISGEACTFEANVFWRLSKDGVVVEEAPTTAASACPDRSAWSVELAELSPGSYKFEVIEYSAEDGSLFATDDKNFVVK
jgi:hypothetical protein